MWEASPDASHIFFGHPFHLKEALAPACHSWLLALDSQLSASTLPKMSPPATRRVRLALPVPEYVRLKLPKIYSDEHIDYGTAERDEYNGDGSAGA
jgi:hypothetical protein